MLKNELTELLKIKYPIIQAPMAGGVTTSKLVAAVSNCGGLGMIGAGYLTPAQLRQQINEVKQLTSKNFGVNLFVPNDYSATEAEIHAANEWLKPICEHLNVTKSDVPKLPQPHQDSETFQKHIQIIIDEKVPICSFTFGLPSAQVITTLKQHGTIVIGTATTVKEANEIETRGLDMVVVQGSEAGGHRGHFLGGLQESMIGLMSLIPQVVDEVDLPVIAAGGIMDGRGLMASLCLGARGVQMGTAFLTCMESGAHPVHKHAILQAEDDDIILTRAFSGKWARGIKNKFTEQMQDYELSVPDFPIQNALTQAIRKASAYKQNRDYMSLWSGQSPRLAKTQTVRQLMETMMEDALKLKRLL
jgi:nitronate monooxygenase